MPVKTKTYTRTIYTLFTREEVQSYISKFTKECHEELLSKGVVNVGKGRITVPRDRLRACVKGKWKKVIQEGRRRELGKAG